MTLSSWINPLYSTPEALHTFHTPFKRNTPFPHIVLPNFLLESRAEDLLRALKKEAFTHKESDLFSFNQTADFSSTQSSPLKLFYSLAASPAFAQTMNSLTGLSVLPGAVDLAGSLYEGGDYLLCHDDQVEDRKIAYILYLSHDFSERDGARFVLFNNARGKPTTEARSYLPVWNSLMIFAVNSLSFHAVEENCSSKKRYAIGGWLR